MEFSDQPCPFAKKKKKWTKWQKFLLARPYNKTPVPVSI